MLMIMRIDTRMDLSSPTMRLFTGIHDVCIQDSCEFQFELNIPVSMERPVTKIRTVQRGDTLNNRNWQQ